MSDRAKITMSMGGILIRKNLLPNSFHLFTLSSFLWLKKKKNYFLLVVVPAFLSSGNHSFLLTWPPPSSKEQWSVIESVIASDLSGSFFFSSCAFLKSEPANDSYQVSFPPCLPYFLCLFLSLSFLFLFLSTLIRTKLFNAIECKGGHLV